MKLEDLRRQYSGQTVLHRKDLLADPIQQFERWLKEAVDSGITDPTAMSLATVDSGLQPSQRTVLLKHVDAKGFVFYTNTDSRKAREIAANHKVSLLFAWLPLNRQVIINGTAEKLSIKDVFNYFVTRPKDSRLAAWASQQSHPISSRQLLEQQFEAMKQKFADGKIPVPPFWGGYRISPSSIEFWQGQEQRLHDRFRYRKDSNDPSNWIIERLAP